MLRTFEEIKNDVIVKSGIKTTSTYFTDAILDDWIKQSERWATAFKKWPFTEGRVSTTFVAGQEEYPFEGYKSDSFRMVHVGGKRLGKITFEDYKIFKEDQESSADRVFSDYGRIMFVNPLIDLAGTLTAWGQYTPAPIDVTEPNSLTVFSNGDEEGNEAIVEKVLSFIRKRQQKRNDANDHLKNAKDILENMEGIVEEELFNYKTKDRGMFERVDVVNGSYYNDGIKRDQF